MTTCTCTDHRTFVKARAERRANLAAAKAADQCTECGGEGYYWSQSLDGDWDYPRCWLCHGDGKYHEADTPIGYRD